MVQSCGKDRVELGEVWVASGWCARRQWTPSHRGETEQGLAAGSSSSGAQGSGLTGARL